MSVIGYTMPAKEIVYKVGLKTGSGIFSEMSAFGLSRIKLEICGDRECCKTDWFPTVKNITTFYITYAIYSDMTSMEL